MEEQAKRTIIEAALIDLTMQLQEGNVLEDFPENILGQIISGLRKYKYPFAPLLLIIDIKSPGRVSDYSFFHNIKNDNTKLLQKRFENIKHNAGELLKKLSQERHFGRYEAVISPPEQIKLKSYTVPNNPSNSL